MKLQVKTLNNEVYSFDVDPEDTVLSLKEKICAQHGHPVSWQRLIHNGHFLEDSSSFKSHSVKDSDSLIIYVKKPVNTSPTTTTTPPAQIQTPTPENNISAIDSLVLMGFDRNNASSALKYTQNNLQRAIQLLCGEVSVPPPSEGIAYEDASRWGEEDSYASLHQILSASVEGSDYESIIQRICSDPEFTNATQNLIFEMDQTRTTSAESPSGVSDIEVEDLESEIDSNENVFSAPGDLDAPIGTIYLTQNENEAIQRLCDLGFDKSNAVEIFFACDKDEQMAANLLLENFKEKF